MIQNKLRNIAIIAHVDHGKTSLVDQLLKQSGTLKNRQQSGRLIMDSNELERERGITILAKNTAIDWQGYRINIVDTPGHADFGGEVERILSMVDSVLLLVDAVEGPMPQTRFVTEKAFARGLNPIVVVNKIDRHQARPVWVINQVFDLFASLGATEQQLDFPVIYSSALLGFATLDYQVGVDYVTASTLAQEPQHQPLNMDPLFQMIVDRVPPPAVDPQAPLQMQISSLDYSSFVGTIGIGRITRGALQRNMPIKIVDAQGTIRNGKVLQIMGFLGLQRYEIEQAQAGDIVAISGIDQLHISDTLCDVGRVEALPALQVDEPTISMLFMVNSSPFAGRDGKFLTSRHLRERLFRELLHNVALRVEETAEADRFLVSGRGELHLGVLIETMRREGYELAVAKPQVIVKFEGERKLEPYERVLLDIDLAHQGAVMEAMGARHAQLLEMQPGLEQRLRLEYLVAARAMIGWQSEFTLMTSGTGILARQFAKYDTAPAFKIAGRGRGVMVANCAGTTTPYALFNLQARGRMLIGPQVEIYEGMIVGINAREGDLVVNPTKEKQLTNMRAAGSDENVILTPPVQMGLEEALEFIAEDELVEVTPHHLRLRKKQLKELDRRRNR